MREWARGWSEERIKTSGYWWTLGMRPGWRESKHRGEHQNQKSSMMWSIIITWTRPPKCTAPTTAGSHSRWRLAGVGAACSEQLTFTWKRYSIESVLSGYTEWTTSMVLCRTVDWVRHMFFNVACVYLTSVFEPFYFCFSWQRVFITRRLCLKTVISRWMGHTATVKQSNKYEWMWRDQQRYKVQLTWFCSNLKYIW